jgi:murein tripeptide amidase MpaA
LMAKFLNRYDIYFLVIGNPDGYEYSYKVYK